MTAALSLEQSIALALAQPDIAAIELDRIDCEQNIQRFIEGAWSVVEPGRPLLWGRVLDVYCEYARYVSAGEITQLIINVPPGCMKSLFWRVFWPLWEWVAIRPSMRYIGVSYADSLSVRDNLRARRIVESEWFRLRWGDRIQLTSDANAKVKFENQHTGWMMTGSVGGRGGTGDRGDRFIIDDANNVKKAESVAVRYSTNQWLGEVVPTRVNELGVSAMLNIQQRTHVDDATGFLLEAWPKAEHVMLPMYYEEERACWTSFGPVDWRSEEDELLWPERFSGEALDDLKSSFRAFGGTYAEEGQLQQRPVPREGGFFAVDQIRIVTRPSAPVRLVVRYWDKAGSDDTGAYTAGVKLAILDNGGVAILDVRRAQFSVGKRENLIKTTAQRDGTDVPIRIEQEGGSGGKDSALMTVRNLHGYNVTVDRQAGQGDKLARAEPFACQIEAGNVEVIEGEWTADYITELRNARPGAKYMDQVDASSGGYNYLTALLAEDSDSIGAPGGHQQAAHRLG